MTTELLELAQSFIEQTGRERRVRVLGAAFLRTLQRMGFRYFACVSHVDPTRPPAGAVMLHNYPSAWTLEYSERRWHEIDPIQMHAERSLVPFFWDSGEFQSGVTGAQQAILSRAADHGIVQGYTVPIHSPWEPAVPRGSCSVVPACATIDRRTYVAVQAMSTHLYAAATRHGERASPRRPPRTLSPRERQCLVLAAQGKSDWAIGQILNISEHSVHHTIEKAKRKLGVSTRVQAIVEAMRSRQICLLDAAGARDGIHDDKLDQI